MYDRKTHSIACPACNVSLGGAHVHLEETVSCPCCGVRVRVKHARRVAQRAETLRLEVSE